MCLGIPMQVIEIQSQTAWVSAGGTRREIRLDIVNERPDPGDYVIVHAGFAIHRIDEQEARETLRLLEQMAGHDEPDFHPQSCF